MSLFCTITEIWCLKDNGVTNLTFWGHDSRDVIASNIRRMNVDTERKTEEGEEKEKGGGEGKGNEKGKEKGKG